MYFNKCEHPINFDFRQRAVKTSIQELGNGVWRLTAADPARWDGNPSQAELDDAAFAGMTSATALAGDADGGFRFGFVSSVPGYAFGVSGKKWMLCFRHDPEFRYFGLGEKNNGFEKSGKRTNFWNTDAMGDFPMHQVTWGVTDPMYVSIPYVIVKNGNEYIGILLNNPDAAFMTLHAPENFRPGQAVAYPPYFMVGSQGGAPEIYFISGPSLPELCAKLQTLCGKHARPPLWAVGAQQCRWGYKSPAVDFAEVDAKYRLNDIPLDGLWMDIDYMNKFQVFTFNPEAIPDPGRDFAVFQEKDRRCVVILDPGVSLTAGYPVYERGKTADVFCKNTEGSDYVGFVWPGATVFPDFSIPAVRDWWAGEVKRFLDVSGLDGFWVDMNDPSTGAAVLDEMRFDHGKNSHATYHNQYALGMQRATFEGFKRHNPNKRPFIVSRSGFISTSRYSAIWTGDNISNYFHLKGSIPMALNLSLSGIPFCGPDVPGFAGEPTRELAVDWYKAGFLFPFFRNHSAAGSPRQEPWTFGEECCAEIRKYIRFRYRLLPYLYNLFIEHERVGCPILRPLFYEFADSPDQRLACIDDEFMVGPAILQAPFVEEGTADRFVEFPAGADWFDVFHARWCKGGETLRVKREFAATPLYFRSGAVIPMAGSIGDHADASKLFRVRLGAYAPEGFNGVTTIRYVADDGISNDYAAAGKFSEARLTVTFVNGVPELAVEILSDRAGKLEFELVPNAPLEA